MSAFDPEEHRRASLEQWEGAAPGWARWQALMRDFAAPVSDALLDALALQPGMTVLDIAAGVGDTGLAAASLLGAELIGPGLLEPPEPESHPGAGHRPGMFALADPNALAELIGAAGFVELRVQSLPFTAADGTLSIPAAALIASAEA